MKWPTFLLWLVSALFLLLILLLLIGMNMRRGLNHDEYQFVASAQLMATTGLLPYRDFPYFHVPGLSLLYAGLFQLSPRLLLSARLFSVFCGWLLVVLLWVWTLVALRNAPIWLRLLSAIGVVLLLIAAPLFIYTSGRAWNHDLPMLLTVCALWLFDRGWRADPSGVAIARRTANSRLSGFRVSGAGLQPALAVCGVLLGLATATRLSFAFALLAFVLAILLRPVGAASCGRPQEAAPTNDGDFKYWNGLHQSGWPERRRALLNLIAGALVGLLPALCFLFWSPQAFFFGNLSYIGLNTQYYRSLATPPQSMTLLGKVAFMADLLRTQPANGLPLLSLVVIGVWAWRANSKARTRLQPIALLWLCMLLSGLVATPSQAQYFYPLWPLALCAIVLFLDMPDRWGSMPLMLLLVAGGLAALLSRSPYQAGLEIVFSPREWYPNKLHPRGQWVRTLVNAGDGLSNVVLTVAPILPLEGGVAIDPALATGPFAWRVAPFLSAAARRRYHLFTPDELTAQLTVTPPRALLVGLENDDVDLDARLVAWAQPQGYVPLALPDEGTLWVSPLAEWGGAIRLGAHTVPPTVQPGATAEVVFYLQNIRPIATNLNILVRLVGADGQEYWRAEGWPWGAATVNWRPGEVWPDGHQLAVPLKAAHGCYRLEMGFYDPETFDPLGDAVAVSHLWVGDRPATAGHCP